MGEEKWSDALGFPGVYRVSDQGKVYSTPRKGSRGGIRKQVICQSNGGYATVKLCMDGVEKTMLVSHLVWEAFNGPIPPGMEINHLNEDKTDNRLCNLELTDRKSNCNWGTRNERLTANRTGQRAQHQVVRYRLDTDEYVDEFKSVREAERVTKIASSDISRCARGLLRRTGDYYWRYKKEEVD